MPGVDLEVERESWCGIGGRGYWKLGERRVAVCVAVEELEEERRCGLSVYWFVHVEVAQVKNVRESRNVDGAESLSLIEFTDKSAAVVEVFRLIFEELWMDCPRWKRCAAEGKKPRCVNNLGLISNRREGRVRPQSSVILLLLSLHWFRLMSCWSRC